jgi:hypothetical protein
MIKKEVKCLLVEIWKGNSKELTEDDIERFE